MSRGRGIIINCNFSQQNNELNLQTVNTVYVVKVNDIPQQ